VTYGRGGGVGVFGAKAPTAPVATASATVQMFFFLSFFFFLPFILFTLSATTDAGSFHDPHAPAFWSCVDPLLYIPPCGSLILFFHYGDSGVT